MVFYLGVLRYYEAMRDHWPMSAMTMAGRISPLGVGLVFGGDLFRPPEP